MTIIKELQGLVALPAYMDDTLANFAHRLSLSIQDEQKKVSPDNHLIAVLCDAGRLAWEQAQMPRNFELTLQLAAAVKALEFYAIPKGHLGDIARDTLAEIEEIGKEKP